MAPSSQPAPVAASGAPLAGAAPHLELHWRYMLVALALAACGGAARSGGSSDDQAPPEERPVDQLEDGEAPSGPADPSAEGSPALRAECSGVVSADGRVAIEVHDQSELDALAGCLTIVSDLTILPFAGVDLRPLASLREVRGWLTLGSRYDVVPESSFPSLVGLESLEGVAGLQLRGVLAPSLRALESLKRFVPFAERTNEPNSGRLFIDHSPELSDLGGLERLEGLRAVVLRSNAKLTSLRGIQLPEVMDQLEIWDSPVADLGDVSRLTQVRTTLGFNQTALQTAAGLERVTQVEDLQFWGNAALRDLSALSALQEVRYLIFNENPQLETPPALDELQSLTGLVVSDNPKLRELPRTAVRDAREIWIERNASLERVLGLSEVRQVYQMRVADNPQLSVLDLGQLQTVTELWVTNNPVLDDGALQPLSTMQYATVRVGGNLGQIVPLAQCPWTGDGLCDEVQHPYGICAAGTDPDCMLRAEE